MGVAAIPGWSPKLNKRRKWDTFQYLSLSASWLHPVGCITFLMHAFPMMTDCIPWNCKPVYILPSWRRFCQVVHHSNQELTDTGGSLMSSSMLGPPQHHSEGILRSDMAWEFMTSGGSTHLPLGLGIWIQQILHYGPEKHQLRSRPAMRTQFLCQRNMMTRGNTKIS